MTGYNHSKASDIMRQEQHTDAIKERRGTSEDALRFG